MEPSPGKSGAAEDGSLPRPGDVIGGKYVIERKLGVGGMGIVLAAHHEPLDQRVAVKVLTSRDENAVSGFAHEARSTARLNSEHIARVTDVGELPNGAPFIVMEYLEGSDLARVLDAHGALPVETAIDYVLQAMEGLAQAHALGIVHRDLKPANLFLATQPNGTRIIKVLDFGISKSLAPRGAAKTGSLTDREGTIGSPAYMSPEQIRHTARVDAQWDVWSLGVVLFELLSGARPFENENLGDMFVSILERDARALSSVRPDIPSRLSDAVARCLKRDRSKRFTTVAEVADAIAPFGPPEAAARAARIAHTLHNVRAEGIMAFVPHGGSGGPPAQRAIASPDAETADGAAYGAVAAARPLRRERRAPDVAQVTGAVAFIADTATPNPHATTDISHARRARSRGRSAIAGVFGALASVVFFLVLRTNAAGGAAALHVDAEDAPAPSLAQPASASSGALAFSSRPEALASARVASREPTVSSPRPTSNAPAAPTVTSVRPTTGTVSRTKSPRLPVSTPVRRAPVSSKKAPSVLDSPD